MSVTFYIPDIGDCVQLVEDWEFPVHLESRNYGLINCIKPHAGFSLDAASTLLAVFEAGTVLQIDRIYIRKGNSAWSSVTFYVKYAPNDVNRAKQGSADGSEQKRKGCRFWAKLANVNEMVVRKIDKSDIPTGSSKKTSSE